MSPRTVFFLFCFLSFQPRSSLSDSVTYSPISHSYSDLLVSISPDLPSSDSAAIIDNLKDWITQGSKVLYQATNGWAYINSVKILLPSSWDKVENVQEALHEVYEDAEIRVELESPVYGNSPFTVQTGGCGDPGEYIQTSSQFFTQYNSSGTDFGPLGQVFVHEWAKFRYGVFEEYGYPGDPLYPMFYYKQVWTVNGQSNQLKPNFCTNVEPVGYQADQAVGGPCSFNAKTGLPNENCIFVATGPTDLTSSIMGLPYFPGNVKFCDETENYIHSPDIPTKHNAKCEGRSVFNVILTHPDFANYTSQPQEKDTRPQFTLLRPAPSQAYVMVLDYSGSMANASRVDRLEQAVKRFLDFDIENGVPVGIVRFSYAAPEYTYIVQEIVPVDDTNRQDIIDKTLALSVVGGTCLGDGLVKGLEAFTKYGMSKGGVMIFLTDGGYACSSTNIGNIENVIGDIVAQEVRVVTIAFGPSADKNIENLASQTGGNAFFVPDRTGPSDINNALTGSLAYQPSVSTAEKEVSLLQKTFTNIQDTTEPLIIDEFSGRDVIFNIDIDSSATLINIEIDLTGGTNSGDEVIRYNFTEKVGVFTQTVAYISSGNYTIKIKGNSQISFVSLLVKSKAPIGNLPITTKCWTSLGEQDLNLSGPDPEKLAIMAQVVQGQNPVIGADVRAYVESDGNQPVEVILKDEGMEPDGIKSDGIYSRYFTDFLTNVGETRYTLTCQVVGSENSMINQGSQDPTDRSRSLPSIPSLKTPSCCGSTAVKEDSVLVSTGSFSRSHPGGLISVGPTTGLGNNLYPPGKITDLQIGNMDFLNGIFDISFTSPGEDLDKGKISSYQIFYSTNRSLLSGSTPESDRISLDHLACNCTLDPVPAMDIVLLTLDMTKFEAEQQYFFLVQATDLGKKNSSSNLAGIYLTNRNALEDLGLTWGIAIAIVVGSMFATFLVAGAVIWHKKHYNW